MTSTDLPTLESAKAHAKRLRTSLNRTGTEISHSKALELVAEQHGYRDWNTLHAAIGNTRPGPPVSVGQTVTGTYLGKRFRADILGVRSMGQQELFRITLRFEEPVNVSAFDSFEVLRRQVSANIGRDGVTAEKTSNGLPQMSIDL